MSMWEEDDREMMDIPPAEPLAHSTVTFNVPMPSVEQVTGEIARQILASRGYDQRDMLEHKAEEAIHDLIGRIVEEKARPMIEALLDTPLRPTDSFGNPVGEPISLTAVLARRISDWTNDVVDLQGNVAKPSSYNRDHYATRLERTIHQIVNRDLSDAVSAQTRDIVSKLKAGATKAIADQIARRIEGMVFK